MRLVSIPREHYSDYRYEVIFRGYKWDPQIEDHNTVAKHVILMDRKTARQLEQWAEQLSEETMRMEEAMIGKPALAKELGLPKSTRKELSRLAGYERKRHVRLMRFDFHPTEEGWAVSEVNSDVPGGLAEASVLPEIAGRYFAGYAPRGHVAGSLLEAFRLKIRPGGTVAFVHATSYSDDLQVMRFISDYFSHHGYRAILAAPDHLRWHNQRASCIIEGLEGELDGIIRFYPLEWLESLPRGSGWQGYYDSQTASCNHPAAILTQSKRLPLVWDHLCLSLPAWKHLLPETKDPRLITLQDEEWIYKPALGRVGENISIKGVVPPNELRQIDKAAHRYPEDWVAQKRFHSLPLLTDEHGPYHLCIGVFTVDGKNAGFYGRISPYPRIDANARDIPILVEKAENHAE